MAQTVMPRNAPTAALDAINHGLRLHKAGKTAEAYPHFERALKQQPNNPQVLWQLGRVLRQMKQPKQALQLLQKVVQLRPTHAEPLLDLAFACIDTHQPEQAVAHLRTAVE